jgi:glycosyltransferase involved in cell wall biosynthesis
MPTLSIIIPTLNRSRFLFATVEQVLAQSYNDFELWIIDQSDRTDTESNVDHFQQVTDPRLSYAHLSHKNLPNARNEGVKQCGGKIILFLDDDVILLTDDFLEAHVRAYDDPKVGGVTGRSVERLVRTNSRRTACHVSWSGRTIFNLLGTERQPIGSCKGSNMSFRASVFHQVGGFDCQTELLEDTDFSVRVAAAGWILLFEPKAELVHLSAPQGGVRATDKIATECRRFRSTAYYVLKHRGVAGFVPFSFIFGLIAVVRVFRFRSLLVLPLLVRATMDGIARWSKGQATPQPTRNTDD